MNISIGDAAFHILQIICICITVGTVKNAIIDLHEQNSILSAVLVVSDKRLRAVRIDGKQARLILQFVSNVYGKTADRRNRVRFIGHLPGIEEFGFDGLPFRILNRCSHRVHHICQYHFVEAHIIQFPDQFDDIITQICIVGIQPGTVFIAVIKSGLGSERVLSASRSKHLIDKTADLRYHINTLSVLPGFERRDQLRKRVGKVIVGTETIAVGKRRFGIPHQLSASRFHFQHQSIAVYEVRRSILKSSLPDLLGTDENSTERSYPSAGGSNDTGIIGRLKDNLRNHRIKYHVLVRCLLRP